MKKVILIILSIFFVFNLCACDRIEEEILLYLLEISPSESLEQSANEIQREKYPLAVHFLDVGQADSAFIELPDGKTMLIDAGNPENAKDVIDFVSNLGYSSIDYVVASHPHEDHIGGMAEVLEEFDIGSFYMPKKEHTTNFFEDMIDVIAEKEIPLYAAKAGKQIGKDADYEIVILSPEKENYDELNNYSAVVKLVWGETEFLFTGDAERKIETALKKLDIEADVLKLGHHGSSTSSGQEFLQKVSPELVVISCGKDNSYGHPHGEVIARLRRLGLKYLRTDEVGRISVYADDEENICVVKEKGNDN